MVVRCLSPITNSVLGNMLLSYFDVTVKCRQLPDQSVFIMSRVRQYKKKCFHGFDNTFKACMALEPGEAIIWDYGFCFQSEKM